MRKELFRRVVTVGLLLTCSGWFVTVVDAYPCPDPATCPGQPSDPPPCVTLAVHPAAVLVAVLAELLVATLAAIPAATWGRRAVWKAGVAEGWQCGGFRSPGLI